MEQEVYDGRRVDAWGTLIEIVVSNSGMRCLEQRGGRVVLEYSWLLGIAWSQVNMQGFLARNL